MNGRRYGETEPQQEIFNCFSIYGTTVFVVFTLIIGILVTGLYNIFRSQHVAAQLFDFAPSPRLFVRLGIQYLLLGAEQKTTIS